MDQESLVQSQRRLPNDKAFRCTAVTMSLAWFASVLVFGGLVTFLREENRAQMDAQMQMETQKLDSLFASKPKNVIIVVPDGMGPAYVTLARDYKQWISSQTEPFNYSAPDYHQGRKRASKQFVPANLSIQLSFDQLLRGTVRTRSWNTLVTDSAASATAYSCGLKTFNLGVGVDHTGTACPTIMEVAKLAGMKVGVVVTSRITHATPGAFTSHVLSRMMESEIAEFQLGLHPSLKLEPVDLLMGGGQRYFLPESVNGSRKDEKDLFSLAKEKHGHTVIQSRQEFDNLVKNGGAKLPLIACFTRDHMSYSIERDPAVEPSLEEMTMAAIDLLSNPKGYVLLIEASRIDMAAHNNDAASILYDVLELDRVMSRLKKHVISAKDTTVVMVSDHDTAGASLAKQIGQSVDYAYFPGKLLNVTNSTEVMSSHLLALHEEGYSGARLEKAIRDSIFKWIGISSPTEDQMSRLTAKLPDAYSYMLAISEIVSDHVEIGFATHGHSAVDINLYALGPGASAFRGNMDNTEIFPRIMSLLGFSVNGKEIRKLRTLLKDVTQPGKTEL